MTLSLSNAQLKTLASQLFLFQPAAITKLPKPVDSTGAASLKTALAPIDNDARYTNFGIGVVDFTASRAAPRIWLHNADAPWRSGSTGKIAILLAAVQLRDDVRKIQASKLLSTPQDYDALFAMGRFWQHAANPAIRAIGWGMASLATAPRITTIVDFAKAGELNFFGLNPDLPDADDIMTRLAALTSKPKDEAHLTWPLATDFDFAERLWLTGAMSDNVAATSCISEIGVHYLKAVQQAYGLFDPSNGMHLQLAGPYAAGTGTRVAVRFGSDKRTYRVLQGIEMHPVNDALGNRKTGVFRDKRSWQPCSAAALTAYLIALVQDKFCVFGNAPADVGKACATIRANLSVETMALRTRSNIVEGVKTANAKVDQSRTKIGLLGVDDGAKADYVSEFAHLETTEKDATAKKLNYGVVATGILSEVDAKGGLVGLSADTLAENIGLLAATALAAL